jgi:hypothetical protein
MPTTSRRSPRPAASPTSRSRGRSSRECRHRSWPDGWNVEREGKSCPDSRN